MSTGKLKQKQQEAQLRCEQWDESCRRVGASLSRILLCWKRGDPLPANGNLCEKLFWSLERKPAAYEAALYFANRIPKLIEYEDWMRGFAALIYQYDEWLGDWRRCTLRSHNVPRAMSQLARQLLCRYPVPSILDEALNQGPDSPYLDWFRLIGNGTSVLKLPNSPVNFTKKQAHCFLQAPVGWTLIQGIRYGQLKAMGASDTLIAAINETFLGREIDVNPFSDTLLLFLAQNANFLSQPLVEQMIDFVRAQRDLYPEYSLKGRTVNSVLKASMAWHAQLGQGAYYYDGGYYGYRRRNQKLQNFTWSGEFVPWSMEQRLKDNRIRVYQVLELCSFFDLIAEGREMHHCVASYSGRCVQGNSRILSVRELILTEHYDENGVPHRELVVGKRLATLEYAPGVKAVVQAQMAFNKAPDADVKAIIHQWAARHRVSYNR